MSGFFFQCSSSGCYNFVGGEMVQGLLCGQKVFIGLLMSLPPGGRLCRPTALHMFVCSALRTVRP